MKLTTARLVLRDPSPADAVALAAYQDDPRYLEHYPEPPDSDAIIATACRWAREAPRVNFQFIVTCDGAVIGCAGVRRAGHAPGAADLGIELAPAQWGAGFAREALAALIEFARIELGVDRLLAETTATNTRAHRLMQRLGFRRVPTTGPEAPFELALA
ncbi:MAG: GNAT family N-acetyltransferase [Planctomycetota bacterium]|nr:GNAT family N-acetyltransferase [Planctomycetota bacterium]